MIFHFYQGNIISTCLHRWRLCVYNWTTSRINAFLQRNRREERRAMIGIKEEISEG
jgi:hypothetical protein